MNLSPTLAKHCLEKGEYYLIERETVENLFVQAGYGDDEEIPNFIKIDGKECMFTENYIEKNGKEYEIVLVAQGFSWEDVVIYEDEMEN
jgi:hypothetical protein